MAFFFFSSRRRHTRSLCDWSSDVCSSDLVPSGFQAGSEAAVAGLSLVTSPPSGVIEASSYAPAYRVVANAIREPSGFQAGPASCPGSLVSRVNPVPFALMTQISLLPLSTSHVNASRVPSGDQAGLDTARGVLVSRVGTPAVRTYTPLRPLRELMNAILVPSGDQVG